MSRFHRWAGLVGLAGLILGMVVAPTLAAEKGDAKDKIQVVVVTGGHKFDEANFPKVFEGHADIQATFSEHKDPAQLFEDISDWKYDTILLYNMSQKITDKQKANFLKLLDRGVGLVCLHHAVANFQTWEEYLKIVGVRYVVKNKSKPDTKPSGFKHGLDMKIHVEDASHPVTAGMKDYTTHDEGYNKQLFVPGSRLLLSTDHPNSDKQIAWARSHGKARVLTFQSGHDKLAYEDKNFRHVVAQSIRWTAKRIGGDESPGDKTK